MITQKGRQNTQRHQRLCLWRLGVIILLLRAVLYPVPASAQEFAQGFSAESREGLGAGLTGYDAAGNLYILRSSWINASGENTLERISPTGARSSLSYTGPQSPQDMAVAPDGNLFIVGWSVSDSRPVLVRLDPSGTSTTLATAGSNEYFSSVTVTSSGALAVGHQVYSSEEGRWKNNIRVLTTGGSPITSIAIPFDWIQALSADRAGNILALGGTSSGVVVSSQSLIRADPTTGTTTVVASSLPRWTNDVAVDADGEIVLATVAPVLVRRTPAGQQTAIPYGDIWPWRVISNPAGDAYIQGWNNSTNEQVIQRVGADGQRTTVFSLTSSNTSESSGPWLQEAALSPTGTLYAVRYRYDRFAGNQYDVVLIEGGQATVVPGSQSSNVQGLAVDSQGNVLISRWSEGYFRLNPDGSQTKLADWLTNAWAIRVSPTTGKVYVGGNNNLAVLQDGSLRSIPLTFPQGASFTFWDFTFDNAGNIILGGQGFDGSIRTNLLYQVSADGGTAVRYDPGYPPPHWSLPGFDATGNTFIPTQTNSIQVVAPDGSLITVVSGILGGEGFQLAFGPDGRLLAYVMWGSLNAYLISGFSGAISVVRVPLLPLWGQVLFGALLLLLGAWHARIRVRSE